MEFIIVIFSFSTRSTKPHDTETVEAVKRHCDERNMCFSALLVSLLRDYLAKEVTKNERRD